MPRSDPGPAYLPFPMPIRFACEHCNSVLSVSSRKAGQEVTCPKCRQPTPVPAVMPLSASVATQPAAMAADASSVAPQLPAAGPVESPSARKTSLPAAEPAVKRKPAAPALDIPTDRAELVQAVAETAVDPPPPPSETNDAALAASAPDSLSSTSYDDGYDDDDEVTWVYEDAANNAPPSGNAGTIDFDRISLPRYVLYGQGALLLAVAFVALTLGVLIGRGSAPPEQKKSGAAIPCYLTGTIQHRTSGGSPVADGGAVVIVVPQDQRPSEKAPIEGLRPEDPLPEADQPSLTRIKSIGGDYARADDQGYFKVRVPDSGEYFLLVVSHHARRKAGAKLDPVHLAQMGRYFLPAPDLVGDRDYTWRSESIKRDKQYTIVFE